MLLYLKMKVNKLKLEYETLLDSLVLGLSDWELLSAYSRAAKTLKRETNFFNKEFEEISFFFYDGDDFQANESLEIIKEKYRQEFSKRHNN